MKKTKVWHVVLLHTHFNDVQEYLFEYYNRGHAIAKLKGLMKKAQASELRYGIRKG